METPRPDTVPLVEQQISALLGSEHIRLTPTALIRAVLAGMPFLSAAQVRSAIQLMVESGRLGYSHRWGITHLEMGRSASRRLSQRILLCSGTGAIPQTGGAVVLRMPEGAAFGTGDHPTTCLALRGIDYALSRKDISAVDALDLGTGTGVLGIAAALLGVQRVTGIDTDPVACHEAVANARAHGVQDRFSIACGTLDDIHPAPVDIIMANLRPPTLVDLAARMHSLTRSQGVWILSGFRSEERAALEHEISVRGEELWSADEKNWCAAVYRLRAGGRESRS